MNNRLARLAVEVNWRHLALGHETFDVPGATFVRNRAFPIIYDANFVFGITASDAEEIDRLLSRASLEYAHASRLTFRVDPFTPPAFEARLLLEGYERGEVLVLLLERDLPGPTRPLDIRPVRNEAGWQAYAALKRLDSLEHPVCKKEDALNQAVADGLVSSNRIKCPPVLYLLAYENEEAVGFCSAWEGPQGVGQVEDLFVRPSSRHRGIATALISRAVATARARGAGPMVIVADAADTPKAMYAALGFQPVAVCRQYGRRVKR